MGIDKSVKRMIEHGPEGFGENSSTAGASFEFSHINDFEALLPHLHLLSFDGHAIACEAVQTIIGPNLQELYFRYIRNRL